VKRSTETARTEGRRRGRATGWRLIPALDSQRLDRPLETVALSQVTEVEIGRGEDWALRRSGTQLRIDLPDRSASNRHARLLRDADGWRIEDAGSKNGTLVNGVEVGASPVADGDVVECGGTFFVLRRGGEAAELPAGLVTRSPALERELAALPKIARSLVPVMIRGESGTGKEGVASAVHELSGRSGPFVVVNCGAIPSTLIESELYGTRRGAFSGALDRPGLVRGAEGGTLFLDEVAELRGDAQASLLRFLQEGEILPIGGDKPVRVNVRIVAATNRDVEALTGSGAFRPDLYARLRGYEVRLPPLRARLEDLGELVAALIERHDPDGPPRSLTRTAARALFQHGWPFNVRELEQVLRSALALATGPEIRRDDLKLGNPPASAPAPVDERERLLALLAKHGGNLSGVARELGTSRSQIHRLLERHRIAPEEFRRG